MGHFTYRLLLTIGLLSAAGATSSVSQDSLVIQDETEPVKVPAEGDPPAPTETSATKKVAGLVVTRRTIENFLVDPLALIPFGGDQEEPLPLISTFVISRDDHPVSVIWDPTACRLVGVYRAPSRDTENEKEESSPYILLAEGPAPFSTSLGAFGSPSYFGFRMVDGFPEFLYQHGRLLIEERLWLDSEKNTLRQQFAVKNQTGSLSLKFPESWKERITSSKGEWKGDLLAVPAGNENEERNTFILSYSLADGE